MWPFTRKPKQPEVSMQTQPVNVNPTPNERSERNEQRMARLELAIAQTADPAVKQRLQQELTRRKTFGK